MSEKAFRLEIVTPKKIVWNDEVISFSAPGAVGGFQVLQSHAPLLSSLSPGEVKLVDKTGKEYRYATSGGFVEVRDNVVVMLAETVERVDEIDKARALAAKERALRRIAERSADTDLDRARNALLRSINRMKITQKN
jgi:F-type H+-transporting ATPase subunit epsilon